MTPACRVIFYAKGEPHESRLTLSADFSESVDNGLILMLHCSEKLCLQNFKEQRRGLVR
jgi:hypothetical protein